MKNLIVGILLLFLASCAQVVPLTGGDIDKTAPTPKEEIPANKTTNFTANRIDILFNEYIQLKDVMNQVIITPQLKEQPEINASGKTVTVKFNEKLRNNTTYKIYFGNSIADITEGNVLKDYEYSFSTGTFIDTLNLKGNVKDSYTDKVIKDSWVMLYFDTSDSIVFKSKPDYLTRTNANGEYILKGLRKGDYKVVVLTDNNKNLLYDNGEYFGYYQKTVSVPEDSIVNLKVFKEKPYKVYISKTEHLLPEKATVIFNTGIDKLNTISAETTKGEVIEKYTYQVNRSKDTLRFYFSSMKYDSVYIKLGFNDDKIDSTLITFLSREELNKQFDRKRLPFELRPVYNQGSTLAYNSQEYKISSSFLIDSLKKDKVLIRENGLPAVAASVSVVQSNEDSIGIRYKWKAATAYEIYMMKGFAKDKFGRESDSLVFSFKTNEKSDYGSLKLTLLHPENTNYVVQLINSLNMVAYEKQITVSDSKDDLIAKNGLEIKFNDLVPETYTIRLIVDANNDNTFTPGVYLKKLQAEKIIIYTQPIKIISDWDIEQKWDLGE